MSKNSNIYPTPDNARSGEGDILQKDLAIIGAGVAGLYMLYKSREIGLDAHIVDRAEDVGGTWYWNRYPGCRCDIESMDYSYSFDEALQQEWDWTEKYPSQPEVLSYLQHVADRFDLKRDISFGVDVSGATYNEDTGRWRVHTSTGPDLDAKYVVMATGVLSAPKDPKVPGIEQFQGRVLRSASWPHEDVDFTGRKVAVLGTGSTGIQLVPEIAKQAEQLLVLQRTPSFSLPAYNRPLEQEEKDQIKRTYSLRRSKARASHLGVDTQSENRSALEVDEATRQEAYWDTYNYGNPMRFVSTFNDLVLSRDANQTAVKFVADRIHDRVNDPDLAERLIPRSYALGTRRPCIDTNYYETFNSDHVELVDLLQDPLTTITPTGFTTQRASYEIDDLVLATGFDAITGALSRIDVQGRNGQRLNDRWAQYPASFMGVMVHGFPNMFTVTGPLSPSVNSNMFVTIEQHVEFIAGLVANAQRHGSSVIEVTYDAEQQWCQHAEDVANQTLFPETDSWYTGANVQGKPRVVLPYLGGVGSFDQMLNEQADTGYPAFDFTSRSALSVTS